MAMIPARKGRLKAARSVFLTSPRAGGHDQVMAGLVEVAHGPAIGDPFPLGEIQQVDDRPAAAVAGQLRQFVDLAPMDLAAVGEEQQIVVRAGHEQMLDGVFLLGLGAGESLAAAVLGPIGAHAACA